MTLRRVVAHDVGVWLSRTKTWLFNTVVGVQPRWRSVVLASRCENSQEFPHDDVFSIRERYGRVVWYAEMALVRAAVTRRPVMLSWYLRRLAPDILHSHFGQVGWANARFAAGLGVTHVVSFYGYDVTRLPRRPIWRQRYREMFKLVDAVLCEGLHMRSKIIELGCDPGKVHVHALGVDVSQIPFAPVVWRRSEPLSILIAASFREKKGIPIALEAVSRVIHDHPNLQIRVTLVGEAGGSDESLRERARILSVIKDRDLKQSISLVGSYSHKKLLETAARHHLFLSPSLTASNGDTEGGAPVGLIEMAAMGLPVVSTRHCDIPNVLGALNREQLVAEGNVLELADAIKWFIANPDRWRDMAVANRQLVEKEQNMQLQVEQLTKRYDKLVEDRRA